MAKKAPNQDKMYDVTFHGEYLAREGGSTVSKPYEITVRMSQELVKDGGAQKNFSNHMWKTAMKEKYPDCVGLAKYLIKNTIDLSGDELTEVQLMNRQQLLDYIKENEYPLEPSIHNDDSLRQFVLAYEDAVRRKDEEAFLKLQESEVANKKAAMDIQKEIDRVNQLQQEEEKQRQQEEQENKEVQLRLDQVNNESEDDFTEDDATEEEEPKSKVDDLGI